MIEYDTTTCGNYTQVEKLQSVSLIFRAQRNLSTVLCVCVCLTAALTLNLWVTWVKFCAQFTPQPLICIPPGMWVWITSYSFSRRTGWKAGPFLLKETTSILTLLIIKFVKKKKKKCSVKSQRRNYLSLLFINMHWFTSDCFLLE